MTAKKSGAFSLRLPADMLEQISALAEETHRDRTSIITEAVALFLAGKTHPKEPEPEQPEKLDRVISLLESIAGNLSHKPQHKQLQTSDAVTHKASAPVTQTATTRPAMNTNDPRFVHVDPEADALIARMTGEMAGLADISNALNALGYVSATGQQWTKSRVRDYRHKLRERGLLNG